jgi:glutathione S-transferase
MKTLPPLPPLTLCDLREPTGFAVETWSPFALKVHRALRLGGLPYAIRRGEGPHAFKELNPALQVPVLLFGDEPIPDSTRILRRIVELVPSLVPDEPRLRAEAWLWEDFADRSLSGHVVAARWADDRNWGAVRDAYFGGAPWLVRRLVVPTIRRRVLAALHARDVTRSGPAALLDDYRDVLDALEARAPHDGFWLGATPTIADVAIFGHLHSLRAGLTPSQAREIVLRPALTDWLDRVDEVTRAPRLALAPALAA